MSSTPIDNRVTVAQPQVPAAGFAPTPENVELLKNTLGDITLKDNELQLFLYQAKRTGLDPLARQIFVMKHGDRVTFMVSIDGQRLVAQRTGEYEGQVGPQWCGPDGRWQDVWLKNDPPAAARVGVYRRGFKEAVYGVATSRSYNTGKGVWREKPDVMLAKCAEALALRKAFPQELSGLYTDEEMPAADAQQPRISIPQAIAQAAEKLKAGGVTERGDILSIIFGVADVSSVQELTGPKMQHVLNVVSREPAADLRVMYIDEPDEVIEGETVTQVTDDELEQIDRDITDLYADKQTAEADEAKQPPTVVYMVPSYTRPKNSKLIHPSMIKDIRTWIEHLGWTDTEVATFMHAVIGKPKPGTFDEGLTVLQALADELNEREAANRKEVADLIADEQEDAA